MFEYALLVLIALIVIILLWWLFGPSNTVDDLQKEVLRLEMEVLALQNHVYGNPIQLENKQVKDSFSENERLARRLGLRQNTIND
jgi:predicted Holliday junction resolvase-like endonuclease